MRLPWHPLRITLTVMVACSCIVGMPFASLTAHEVRTNLAIDIPSTVMPKTVVNQVINTTQTSENTRVNTAGSGELSIASALADSGDGIAIGIELSGSGSGTVHVQRGRMRIVAQANTSIHGQQEIVLGKNGAHVAIPSVTVDTSLCPQQVTYCAKLSAVSRLGSKIGEAAFQKRKAEFEARANVEARESISKELTTKIKDAFAKFNGDAQKKLSDIQDNFGVQIDVLSSHGGSVGRVQFGVSSNQDELPQKVISQSATASLRSTVPELPAISNDGRIAIHLSEECLSRFADCLSHRTLSELEFGEMLFEQIGFLTEYSFDSTVPTVPSEVTIAGGQPIRVRIDEDLIELTVQLQSFSDEEGNELHDNALMIGRYSVEREGELLRLVRVANPDVFVEQPQNQSRLIHIAEHFFPSRAEFVGLNFLSLLLSDVETDPAVLRVSNGWLSMATDVKLDPQFFTNSAHP